MRERKREGERERGRKREREKEREGERESERGKKSEGEREKRTCTPTTNTLRRSGEPAGKADLETSTDTKPRVIYLI